MSNRKQVKGIITSQVKYKEDIYDIWVKEDSIAKMAKPGQFVSFYCEDKSQFLPRPISICEIDKMQGLLRFVYRVVGKGTKEFSNKQVGEEITMLGPLGNGFCLEGKKVLILGGGIGIPPMLELAKQLQAQKQIILGYRDTIFLEKEFQPYGEVYISTEDGSIGTKGTVLDVIKEQNLLADMIFACGPTPMLRAVKEYAKSHHIKAQLSLEERMACGIGACLACVCQSKEIDEHTNVHNKRICKEGPVFYANEIEL